MPVTSRAHSSRTATTPDDVVFRDGLPAAFIDVDQCRRTTRVLDLVNALGYWAPLAPAKDRPAALRDADVPGRVRLFADAYGIDAAQREQVLPMALARTRNAMQSMEAAAKAGRSGGVVSGRAGTGP